VPYYEITQTDPTSQEPVKEGFIFNSVLEAGSSTLTSSASEFFFYPDDGVYFVKYVVGH